MTIQLTRSARIIHHAGEILEVSPEEAHFLLSVGSAVAVADQKGEKKDAGKGKKRAASNNK